MKATEKIGAEGAGANKELKELKGLKGGAEGSGAEGAGANKELKELKELKGGAEGSGAEGAEAESPEQRQKLTKLKRARLKLTRQGLRLRLRQKLTKQRARSLRQKLKKLPKLPKLKKLSKLPKGRRRHTSGGAMMRSGSLCKRTQRKRRPWRPAT